MTELAPRALARQWRPQQLSEIKGQPALVTLLSNALTKQRIHHAYLFSGLRGTGKTSVARILAKCLNCETGPSPSPCLTCDHCRRITKCQHIDVIEIDAASRTRVEETRELLENIALSPQSGRYKIYIIDEVHMLSIASFNALLKTLEEPPAHVVFILATTEPDKLPPTVRSRCLHVPLAPIATDEIVAHLKAVLTEENIAFEEAALTLIAEAGAGSMRDALSVTERAIALTETITEEAVANMTGLVATKDLDALITSLAEQDLAAMQRVVTELFAGGRTANELFKALAKRLYQLTLAQIAGTDDALKGTCDPAWVQRAYSGILEGQQQLPYSPSARIGFEMALMRVMHFVELPVQNSPALKSVAKETKVAQAVSAPVQAKESAPLPSVAVKPEPSAPTATSTGQFAWPEMIAGLQVDGLTKVLAKHCVLDAVLGNVVKFKVPSLQKACASEPRVKKLTEAINAYTGGQYQLEIAITDEKVQTPQAVEVAEKAAHVAAQTAAVEGHDVVRAVSESLSAEIESIELRSTE